MSERSYFKGRNFRGQKLSRFRVFWPYPRKFMSAKLSNNNHPRKFMSAKIFGKFICEILCPGVDNQVNINTRNSKITWFYVLQLLFSVLTALKVVKTKIYFQLFYQILVTAKVYVREISEIWSSAKVYVREIQKFRGIG